MAKSKKPFTATEATYTIREIAQNPSHTLLFTAHSDERLDERGIIMRDILMVLKYGFVHEPPKKATREGFWKCKIVGTSSNSGNRQLAIVAIPDKARKMLKLVTILWIDEKH